MDEKQGPKLLDYHIKHWTEDELVEETPLSEKIDELEKLFLNWEEEVLKRHVSFVAKNTIRKMMNTQTNDQIVELVDEALTIAKDI